MTRRFEVDVGVVGEEYGNVRPRVGVVRRRRRQKVQYSLEDEGCWVGWVVGILCDPGKRTT